MSERRIRVTNDKTESKMFFICYLLLGSTGNLAFLQFYSPYIYSTPGNCATMEHVHALLEMGFVKEKVEYALKVTNHAGLEAAMEWLLAHSDEEIPMSSVKLNKIDTEINQSDNVGVHETEFTKSPQIVKSLKCEDCGKHFKDNVEAEYHALRTKHSNFSESTEEKQPLTVEEMKEQQLLIREKMEQKRKEREERDRADELERERNRIKSGKEMSEARARLEHLEMQKMVELRKREKAEEKAARDRVRAQIEADKAARKARGPEYKPTSSLTETSKAATNIATVSHTPVNVTKMYTHTRIQVRLQDGSVLTETFSVKEQLSAVRLFIQVKTGNDNLFSLMTTFPRKVFADDDYEKPLDALGLVPSAVITITKATS